ncbi:hypothetical protein Tco_0038785 [Tanacetum coccineum]
MKHTEDTSPFPSRQCPKGNISIDKVTSEDNITGILSLPLKCKSLNYLRLGLGMMEHIPPSDEVFTTWMAFGGNTRDLGSFGEETDKITDLHRILEEILLTKRGDDVASIKRRRRDLFSDGVWNLETTSGCG